MSERNKMMPAMKIRPTLYLMVRLPCSGKTTKAKQLELELSAIRFTPDEFHVGVFGHDTLHPDHDSRHNIIEALLWRIASRALLLGANVILDFGFWGKSERDDYRNRAATLGARSEIIFMDVEKDELLKRISIRNASLTDSVALIPEEMAKSWINSFEAPSHGELLAKE